MSNPLDQVGAVSRALESTERDGAPARVLSATRTYPAPAADVWDALTDPDRIARWFLPVSGDLRLGGRYQLEGNAGGTVETCDPPHSLALTWEFAGDVSWVAVTLTPRATAPSWSCGTPPTSPPSGGPSSGPARPVSAGTWCCS